MPKHGHSEVFPERLKRLRLRLGYDQSAFAVAAGVQAQSIRNWEERGSTPGLATLASALHNLRVPDRELLLFWLAFPESTPPEWIFEEGPVARVDAEGSRPSSSRGNGKGSLGGLVASGTSTRTSNAAGAGSGAVAVSPSTE